MSKLNLQREQPSESSEHSTNAQPAEEVSEIRQFINEYSLRIHTELAAPKSIFPSFGQKIHPPPDLTWLEDNENRFFKETPNKVCEKRIYLSEHGFLTSIVYSPDGEYLVCGHSTGLTQVRHGTTGIVLKTLRHIQYPAKPIYAIHFSRTEDRICYAASSDGNVYRIDVPLVSEEDYPQEYSCLTADPGLESLITEYFSPTSESQYVSPFVKSRSPALCFGITADQSKMAVGYADWSLKLYDMETQECIHTYKTHKTRLAFIPPKLQRIHRDQVCALACHDEIPTLLASAGWDRNIRIWDTRVAVGCMTTFEGVNVCGDSIDLCRDVCISGSWQPTEALTVWDLKARRRHHIVRVQNRRPNVDGEYIYACKFWNSSQYNRKGKYAIIGGSGLQAVEVINLHNRYITCSYPAEGVTNSVTSFQDRIAFGGSAPVIHIVSFHDPKHEVYKEHHVEVSFYEKATAQFGDDVSTTNLNEATEIEYLHETTETLTNTTVKSA